MVRYRTSDTWVSRKGRHLFTKNDPEHPYKQNKKNSKKQKPVSVEEILRTALWHIVFQSQKPNCKFPDHNPIHVFFYSKNEV